MAKAVTDQAQPSTGQSGGAGFVHLHLHSEYSLLDGGNRVERLVARVKELGMDAVAVTDHGNLFGAVEFYQSAKAAGIKPILGVEAYVAPGDRTDRTHTGVQDGGYHLVLLAETHEGWLNLLVLCSEAYLTGFYYKPRIDRALLERHNAGLIAINGHLGSEIGEHLLAFERSKEDRHWRAAVDSAAWHARVFADAGTGPRFFVELQHHVPEQNSINKHLVRLARELKLPLAGNNDAHFLRAEDHDAHDTLICISTSKLKDEPDRMRYTPELYVKSPAAMRELFERELGEAGREACDNALSIAARCNVDLPLGANHAPMVRVRRRDGRALDAPGLPTPKDSAFKGDLGAWYGEYCGVFEVLPVKTDGISDREREKVLAEARAECDLSLALLARAGYVWRYGEAPSGEREARLARELAILADKGISAYFLIVWDFVTWGRARGIPALARGSGVGTMVGYVLGLSNACPVKYGLLFERFTDPDRSEYPDIDIDLCQDGRAEVIGYVREKYGHVAQIITFGTLKARAAVRDVARVLGVSLGVADRVAKMIPEALGTTLDDAIEREPDFRALYEGRSAAVEKVNADLPPAQHITSDRLRQLIDNARALEGHTRHAGVHAAGVIVATRPLREIVPLYKPTGAGEHEVVTQWDGPCCEKMGLLKMDFLGLRTLSVIERAKALIRQGLDEPAIWSAVGRMPGDGGPGHPLDLDRLTCDDQVVLEMFRRGDCTGVFQFESGGMRRLLTEMKPDRLEDLIAANALFRPGPMDLIPDYNRRKHGQEEVPKVHPIVDRYTAETYGVMVYQEQVMQIVHELGGIPLRSAYSLIKAISKKKEKEIEKNRGVFIAGAKSRGLSQGAAEELFETILKFAGYGFNKSHSTGYAIIAYQTAYLKTYFPNQYMAAFLTYESAAGKAADWIPYLQDCKNTRFVDPKTGRVARIGVEVKPPDVNLSHADFTVVLDPSEPRDSHHGHVRFGLGGIKGAGAKAVAAIIAERERPVAGPEAGPAAYASLFDFCERVLAHGAGVMNKATVESLVASGAFDSIHGRAARASMCASIEQAMSAASKAIGDRAAGQGSLFGGGGPVHANGHGTRAAVATDARAGLVSAQPWTEAQTLAKEKEILGFYLSSHPLDRWAPWSEVFATHTTETVRAAKQDARAVVAGVVQGVRTIIVKQGRAAGQKMAIVTIEDRAGSIEGVIFSDVFTHFAEIVRPDAVLYFLGRADHAKGDPQLVVERVVPIDGVPLSPGSLRLLVDPARLPAPDGAGLTTLAQRLRGLEYVPAPAPSKAAQATAPVAFPVELLVLVDDSRVLMQPDPPVRIVPTPELVRELSLTLGAGAVRVVRGVAVEVAGARPSKPHWKK